MVSFPTSESNLRAYRSRSAFLSPPLRLERRWKHHRIHRRGTMSKKTIPISNTCKVRHHISSPVRRLIRSWQMDSHHLAFAVVSLSQQPDSYQPKVENWVSIGMRCIRMPRAQGASHAIESLQDGKPSSSTRRKLFSTVLW